MGTTQCSTGSLHCAKLYWVLKELVVSKVQSWDYTMQYWVLYHAVEGVSSVESWVLQYEELVVSMVQSWDYTMQYLADPWCSAWYCTMHYWGSQLCKAEY